MRTAGARVRQAAMYLDRGMALAGGSLAGLPAARLGLVGYLVLLHVFVWVSLALSHRHQACVGAVHP